MGTINETEKHSFVTMLECRLRLILGVTVSIIVQLLITAMLLICVNVALRIFMYKPEDIKDIAELGVICFCIWLFLNACFMMRSRSMSVYRKELMYPITGDMPSLIRQLLYVAYLLLLVVTYLLLFKHSLFIYRDIPHVQECIASMTLATQRVLVLLSVLPDVAAFPLLKELTSVYVNGTSKAVTVHVDLLTTVLGVSLFVVSSVFRVIIRRAAYIYRCRIYR